MRNSKYRINKIDYMVWHSDRQMVRFFVGFASLIWAGIEFWTLATTATPGASYFSQNISMLPILSPYLWPVMFLFQGTAAMYAVLKDRIHIYLVILENVLACLLWGAVAVFNVIRFDSVTVAPAMVALPVVMFLITLWLMMRADYGA